uniref:Uncharacterized protein n=1 Tax=Anguilla anguilla TaxID=7936 RepID=A0A0E9QKW6_ANGAN
MMRELWGVGRLLPFLKGLQHSPPHVFFYTTFVSGQDIG